MNKRLTDKAGMRSHLKPRGRLGWREYLYAGGMVLAFGLMVLGQLVWLPDPLNFGSGRRWIDILNGLVYILAVVPLLWTAAAAGCIASTLRAGRRLHTSKRSMLVIVLSLSAVAAIITLETEAASISWAAGLLGAAWLAVFMDLANTERQLTKRSRRTLAAFCGTLALMAFLFWPTNYMVTYPGLTMDMSRYAQAEGGKTEGRIDGVLIFHRPAFPVDWLYAKLFPHYSFEPIEELGMPLGEYDELVREMKTDADAAASAIAYERLGSGAGIIAQGVRVTGIETGSPVLGVLRAGDIVTELNGEPVLSVVELNERLKDVPPGGWVQLTVMREKEEVKFAAPTRADKNFPERAVFGIRVQNVLYPDVPGRVSFRDYLVHEGGPSHGAMLALALIDQLTPEGITGDIHVAGTGTIGPGGVVGTVGGVEQKAYTVYRAGADVFFVPAGQEDEAHKGAPELEVVPVRNLDDILNWLKTAA
ncbi:PDZ domain-containing protein [Paenibacillus tarimensis]|uniref:PDZ domain-containing protein n=1 Tax=Paenibacillus tarimensis TaxID=416012 RepID=UPI001F356A99|nr:PDZ domain-containing protein [Paenibacillus tarimensis]MCF2945042.1 PDZ domain-containing protein [Paenibacillus tarimensis]